MLITLKYGQFERNLIVKNLNHKNFLTEIVKAYEWLGFGSKPQNSLQEEIKNLKVKISKKGGYIPGTEVI